MTDQRIAPMSSARMNATNRRIERFADWVGLFERYFTGCLLIAMTSLYVLNIFVRAVVPTYASAFAWIDDAARYMMIGVVFLASGIALETGRHVSVNILQQYLPSKILSVLFKAIDVVGLFFSIGMSYLSLNLAVFVAGTGEVSPTLGIPTFVLYVAPCLGFLLLAVRYLLRIFGLRDARRNPESPLWLRGEQGI